ncbi:MAG: hypothetical protein SAJ12_22530 [Jaaginema sp. PMC 1079.18]|nr:hypothetical protein [Jaaginema sp. PMC 1080.18]MEC4853766.1 hypothetical protein [Jaaginema sp. PMC 1079.18]MEC4864611.1 hypothetical protein [Jaaginema sp. PMC 1078.18]
MKFNPIRILVLGFCCALLFLGSATPAWAAASSPTKGTEQLNQVQQETDKSAQDAPSSIEEVQAKTKEGLNAVQGSADRDKMKGPESTTPTDTMADSFKKGIERMMN